MLARDALALSRLANDVRFVEDGEELLDYLYMRGKYSEPGVAPRPGVILVDLNMPRKDGREAIEALKSDPELRQIPVVVLTTSNAEQDVSIMYGLGISSYITKPVTFDALVTVMRGFTQYWLEIVELPPNAGS